MYRGSHAPDSLHGWRTGGEAAGPRTAGQRRTGFLLHLRPRVYQRRAVSVANTWLMGFTALFLFAVEVLSGVLLMVYYVPTPEAAYGSILHLTHEVPFGLLLRDIHRLAGELMIAAVLLHMVRVLWTGSYTGVRGPTWRTGIYLLLCTLGLGFTGYLLPWDQLAYWAVTVGTSIVRDIPLAGPLLNTLLRGGEHIDGNGLLRFYLLHVIGLPLVTILLLALHYYRVARVHGISMPANAAEAQPSPPTAPPAGRTIPLYPDLLQREALYLLILTPALLVAGHFYAAPLEMEADPTRTPLLTRAPWFFLWAQGLLKLGPAPLMGLALPLGLLFLLLLLPALDRTPRRPMHRRRLALPILAAACLALLSLSWIGTSHVHPVLSPGERLLYALVPEQGPGPFASFSYDALQVGIYPLDGAQPGGPAPPLAGLLTDWQALFRKAVDSGLPAGARGVLLIEDWQADLRRITIRVSWPDGGTDRSMERHLFIHRHQLPREREA